MQVNASGYDNKVNETVNVVTTKTSEIGHRTWGIMKGVVALASHKVEELTKEGGGWDDWQQQESDIDGYYQEFGHENKGENTDADHSSNQGHSSRGSWDDWNETERKEPSSRRTPSGESWGGWDDGKDDGYDDYSHGSSNKDSTQSGKSAGSFWTEGGFR